MQALEDLVQGAGWVRDSAGNEWMAEAVRAPIVIPPDISKLAIEELLRAGITLGWQHGRAGSPLPEVDITWDGDDYVWLLKSRG